MFTPVFDKSLTRVDVGNRILERAKTVDTHPIRKALTAFASAHRTYAAADNTVWKAEQALREHQKKVAAIDILLDLAIDELAESLIAEHDASPSQPFKAFGFPSPTAMKNLGFEREAKEAIRFVKYLEARKMRREVKGAMKGIRSAVRAVRAILSPLEKLESALSVARARREQLALPWEKALALLKQAALLADDGEGHGLYDALFHADRHHRSGKPNGAGVMPPPTSGG